MCCLTPSVVATILELFAGIKVLTYAAQSIGIPILSLYSEVCEDALSICHTQSLRLAYARGFAMKNDHLLVYLYN